VLVVDVQPIVSRQTKTEPNRNRPIRVELGEAGMTNSFRISQHLDVQIRLSDYRHYPYIKTLPHVLTTANRAVLTGTSVKVYG
jgi:hypothetical protein